MTTTRGPSRESQASLLQGGDRLSMVEEFSRLYNDLSTIQRELAKKNMELRETSERKSLMLGVAAHDLRNPLGVISNYADFLERTAAAKLDDREIRMLRHIRESSAFMQTLIEDLMNLSQAETGKLKLLRQPTNLSELVETTISLNAAMAAQKNIRIDCLLAEPLPLADVDPHKIRQVINNLLTNATKFSHPETAITVSVRTAHPFVEVAVADEGQGIPKHELAKLFKPFSRTSVGTTAGEPSSGMGLAICRSIVEGHGGTIVTESTPGIGTTLTFTVPVWQTSCL